MWAGRGTFGQMKIISLWVKNIIERSLMMGESSEEGVDKNPRCFGSWGDIEETGGASFGDVEGDVDSMKDSDDSKEHSERSENTEQLKSWT